MQAGRTPGADRHISGTPVLNPTVRWACLLAVVLSVACAKAPSSTSLPRLSPDNRDTVPAEPAVLPTRRPVALSLPTDDQAPVFPEADAPVAEPGSLNSTLQAVFDRARGLVEAESDTDLSTIRLQLVDDESIFDEVSAETHRLVHGQLGDGVLATRLLDTLLRGQSGTYAALYSGRKRAILVSRDVLTNYLDSLPQTLEARDDALLVLMLHEMVHAADDVRHGIYANRDLDFRASFAQSAVFEGHAQWLTRSICRREKCLDGLATLDAFMFDEVALPEPTDDVPVARRAPLDRNLLEYSYVEGERFIAALAARKDGTTIIEGLLAEPPHDPLQILSPESFPDITRESRNRVLLETATSVEHPWLQGSTARVPVATSPLKGVDLRANPARRAAAVDGFTRLVTSMVALQFHDPGSRARPPIEVTLMRTDERETARLFADTLHAHAQVPGSRPIPADARVELPDGTGALLRTELPLVSGETWHTVIAAEGHFVVQATGRTQSPAMIDDYVRAVLVALVEDEPA